MNLRKITLIVVICIYSQIMASDDLQIKIEYGQNFLNIQKYQLGQGTRILINRNIDLYSLDRQHLSEEFQKMILVNKIKDLFDKINTVYDKTEIENKVSLFINEIKN